MVYVCEHVCIVFAHFVCVLCLCMLYPSCVFCPYAYGISHTRIFVRDACTVMEISVRANFFFGPTSDLENFSHLVNLPFLFVLRKVTLLRGLVNLGDKTLESTQLAWVPGGSSQVM